MAADLIGSQGWQQIWLILMDGSRSDWILWMAAGLVGFHRLHHTYLLILVDGSRSDWITWMVADLTCCRGWQQVWLDSIDCIISVGSHGWLQVGCPSKLVSIWNNPNWNETSFGTIRNKMFVSVVLLLYRNSEFRFFDLTETNRRPTETVW
jgi:hypothetical protein